MGGPKKIFLNYFDIPNSLKRKYNDKKKTDKKLYMKAKNKILTS